MTGHRTFWKGEMRPAALVKQDRKKVKQSVEERENAIVKARSGGQCEVRERTSGQNGGISLWGAAYRCRKAARHIHHLLGGSGRRGIKESALAVNKLHVCEADHDLITRHILQQHWTDVNNRAETVYYVRLK